MTGNQTSWGGRGGEGPKSKRDHRQLTTHAVKNRHKDPMTPEDNGYHLHPMAAHRVVGGEVFVVTDDRAFHRVSVPSAVELVTAIARPEGAPRDALIGLLVQRFQVERERAANDVDAFLATLVQRKVAVAPGQASSKPMTDEARAIGGR